MTHKSASGATNERLEFLGDRVLGLVVADLLYAHFPQDSEGLLAPRLNALVRKETCAAVAEKLDLGTYLVLAPGEERSGGRKKVAILGDAMEAVIGAIYLDGGIEAARALVARLWTPLLSDVSGDMRDAKSALQEWSQGNGCGTPSYKLVSRIGPDHQPVFSVSVQLNDARTASGEGASLRAAEQEAARALLQEVQKP